MGGASADGSPGRGAPRSKPGVGPAAAGGADGAAEACAICAICAAVGSVLKTSFVLTFLKENAPGLEREGTFSHPSGTASSVIGGAPRGGPFCAICAAVGSVLKTSFVSTFLKENAPGLEREGTFSHPSGGASSVVSAPAAA